MTRRVLVVRLDSIGDVVLAGPAVRAIAAGTGGEPTEVWMLCGPQGAPAAALLPGVHHVLTWSCPWIVDPSPPVVHTEIDALLEMIAGCAPSEAVILTSFHQSPLPIALLLRQAGVSRLTGASVDFAGSLLDVRLRPGEDFPEDQPESMRALTLARAAGFELPAGDNGLLALRPTPDPPWLTARESYVVVHPGASAPARTWPPERYRVAVSLLADRGVRTVVTGAPSERSLTAHVAGSAGRDLGGRSTLPELVSIIARSGALITGNTGPAHLAAAVGTPVVSLFSPVVPAIRWAPYGVPVELLGDQDARCRGTRARVCPVPDHPCLTGVAADEVVEATLRLLEPAPEGDA